MKMGNCICDKIYNVFKSMCENIDEAGYGTEWRLGLHHERHPVVKEDLETAVFRDSKLTNCQGMECHLVPKNVRGVKRIFPYSET